MLSGPEEIRTPNPLHAMEVRYRCATGPTFAYDLLSTEILPKIGQRSKLISQIR